MNKNKVLIIAIVIVAVVGIGVIAYGFFSGTIGGPDLTNGKKNILVLAADEGEKRPGLGAVDMSFIITLENGSIKKYTPFYPGGKTHPTASEPAEAQAQGAGSKLLMHESLWYEDNQAGMQLAKEIVESNTNVTIDAVIAANTEAIDAIIKSAGELTVDGQSINISSIDLVRENDQLHGGTMTRGEAVLNLARAISKAATDPNKRAAMVQTAIDQFSKGNIVARPENALMDLASFKGFGSIANI
jgi:anionic cell wall polymer biosynthesis LytR-Cps2A-Psr (LCP) family protein